MSKIIVDTETMNTESLERYIECRRQGYAIKDWATNSLYSTTIYSTWEEAVANCPDKETCDIVEILF